MHTMWAAEPSVAAGEPCRHVDGLQVRCTTAARSSYTESRSTASLRRAGNGFGGGPRAVAAQLARAVEIATILSASGFDWLVQALGLSTWVSPRRLVCALRPGTKCPPPLAADVPLPERLRLTLERLGPTFVKAGQMLALRPDYVPLEYAEALRGLHTHVAPFPPAEAVAIVEAELGAPLGALYAEFDREPFAAASLAQVHRARLFDGRQVAVKVQRPGIRVQVERDLALLATLARRFERHSRPRLPSGPRRRWQSWPSTPGASSTSGARRAPLSGCGSCSPGTTGS